MKQKTDTQLNDDLKKALEWITSQQNEITIINIPDWIINSISLQFDNEKATNRPNHAANTLGFAILLRNQAILGKKEPEFLVEKLYSSILSFTSICILEKLRRKDILTYNFEGNLFEASSNMNIQFLVKPDKLPEDIKTMLKNQLN